MGLTDEGRHRDVISSLRDLQSRDQLRKAHVNAAAVLLNAHPRTIRRHIANGVPTHAKPKYELTAIDLELYVAESGSATAVHAARARDGDLTVSLRTMQRAFARLSPQDQAYARGGTRGRRAATLYVSHSAHHRNETWQTDHWQADLPVLVPRHTKPLYPWLTWFLDDATRAIMGWAISIVAATSAEVLAAFRRGVELDPLHGPFCGAPSLVRTDNGREFTAGYVTDRLMRVGTVSSTTDAYAPHQKGKIERLHRTVNGEFLRGKPGWKGGGRTAAGKVYAHKPWTLERFRGELSEWVRHYNLERPHRGLDGRTPLQAWEEDPAPVRMPPEHVIRGLHQARTQRKVAKDGIHFASVTYWSPSLHGIVGETVEIDYVPHDRRKIDVYRAHEFLCTCVPTDAITDQDRQALYEARQRDAQRLRKLRSDANRRQRVRLAAITDATPLQEISIVTEAERNRERPPTDAALRRLTSKDLLKLDRPEDEAQEA